MIFMRDLSKYVAYKKVINLLPAILWLICAQIYLGEQAENKEHHLIKEA